MNKRIILFTLPLMLLALAGCKPKEVITEGPKKITEAEAVLARNKSTRLEYNSLSFKGKGTMQDEETNLSFTYKITVIKDSLIYASVSKFGVTAYKLLADPDSVRVRKTLEKTAEICDYSIVKRTTGFDLDFYDLQDVLVGDMVSLTDSLDLVGKEEGNYHFEGIYHDTRFDYYLKSSHAKLVQMEVTNERRKQSSRLQYLNMQPMGKQKMPHHILFELFQPRPGKMEFEHAKVEIDPEEVKVNFRIPSSYEVYRCIR